MDSVEKLRKLRRDISRKAAALTRSGEDELVMRRWADRLQDAIDSIERAESSEGITRKIEEADAQGLLPIYQAMFIMDQKYFPNQWKEVTHTEFMQAQQLPFHVTRIVYTKESSDG